MHGYHKALQTFLYCNNTSFFLQKLKNKVVYLTQFSHFKIIYIQLQCSEQINHTTYSFPDFNRNLYCMILYFFIRSTL